MGEEGAGLLSAAWFPWDLELLMCSHYLHKSWCGLAMITFMALLGLAKKCTEFCCLNIAKLILVHSGSSSWINLLVKALPACSAWTVCQCRAWWGLDPAGYFPAECFLSFEDTSWPKWECSSGMCWFWQIAAARGVKTQLWGLLIQNPSAPKGPRTPQQPTHLQDWKLDLVLPKGSLPTFLQVTFLGKLDFCRQTRQASLLPHKRAFLNFFKSYKFSHSGSLFFWSASNTNL